MIFTQTFDEVFPEINDDKKIIIPIAIADQPSFNSIYPLIKRQHHHFKDLARGLHFAYFLNLTETIESFIKNDFLKQPSEKESFFSKRTKNQRMMMDLINFNNEVLRIYLEKTNTKKAFSNFGFTNSRSNEKTFLTKKLSEICNVSLIKKLDLNEFIETFVKNNCVELYENQNKTIILPFIPKHIAVDFAEYCRKNLINIILISKHFLYNEKENSIIEELKYEDNGRFIFNEVNNGIFYYETNELIVNDLRNSSNIFKLNFETFHDFTFNELLNIQEEQSYKIINSLFFESNSLLNNDEKTIELARLEYILIKDLIKANHSNHLFKTFFLESKFSTNNIEKIHPSFATDVLDLLSHLSFSCRDQAFSKLQLILRDTFKNKEIYTKYSNQYPTDFVKNYIKTVKNKEEIKELINVFEYIKIPFANFSYQDFSEIGPHLFEPADLSKKYVIDETTIDQYEYHIKKPYAQDFFTIDTKFITSSKKFNVLYKTSFEKRCLILRFVKGSNEIRQEIINDFLNDKIDFDYRKFTFTMYDYGFKRDMFPQKNK